MIVFIQYPVVDLRYLLNESHGKLTSPSWPLPRFSEFLKYAGQISRRKKGGISGWIGENEIGSIKNSFKVDEQRGIKIKSRHFYHDGHVTAKYEFVFQVDSFLFESIDEILNALNRLTVRVRVDRNKKEEVKFGEIRPTIGQNYFFITTKSSFPSINVNHFISVGSPAVFIYEYRSSGLEHPKGSKTIESLKFDQNQLSYCWKRFKNVPYKIWYLTHSAIHFPVPFARSLRISLLRLQTEEECVREVLGLISKNRLLEDDKVIDKKRLVMYSEKIKERITKKENKLNWNVSVEEVTKIIYQSFEEVTPGLYSSIENSLENLRVNYSSIEWLYAHIKDSNLTSLTIMENTTITQSGQGNVLNFNSQIYTQSINQSFASLEKSKVGDEQKTSMKDLKDLIEQMIKDGGLKESDVKTLTNDYDDLSKEVVSEEPRKSRIENILDGITKFAEKTEKFLKPVQSISKIIVGFFI